MPEGVVSVTDPDTQRMKANHGYVQGYNAQAVVDEAEIVIAAEITNTPADFSNLNPMLEAALGELEQAGVTERPELALADAGYWNEQHMDEVIANKHVQVLIPTDSAGRAEPRPGWTAGRYSWMRTVLGSHGKLLYRRRIQMIEPVFAHTKHNRTITRFHRRGRKAVRTGWRLLMATHNLTKGFGPHPARSRPVLNAKMELMVEAAASSRTTSTRPHGTASRCPTPTGLLQDRLEPEAAGACVWPVRGCPLSSFGEARSSELPGSMVFCSAGKAATSEPASSPSLPDSISHATPEARVAALRVRR